MIVVKEGQLLDRTLLASNHNSELRFGSRLTVRYPAEEPMEMNFPSLDFFNKGSVA